ncbi:MAG: hypothetical protein L6R37_001078 [Teloschistes peruensis]|nr:MAG: hypothetical protein L6R37_001078 [Teloschistes peruensis]
MAIQAKKEDPFLGPGPLLMPEDLHHQRPRVVRHFAPYTFLPRPAPTAPQLPVVAAHSTSAPAPPAAAAAAPQPLPIPAVAAPSPAPLAPPATPAAAAPATLTPGFPAKFSFSLTPGSEDYKGFMSDWLTESLLDIVDSEQRWTHNSIRARTSPDRRWRWQCFLWTRFFTDAVEKKLKLKGEGKRKEVEERWRDRREMFARYFPE